MGSEGSLAPELEMIAHLRGTLLDKKPGQVILEVGGVGYKVLIPLSTYYELDGEGATVSFRVHTHVREDIIALFGFLTEIEEVLFQRLISVAGVGPALALKVLSGLEPADLVDAIRHGDLRRLGSIPGVGKKTAERLVVELKDKMPELLARVGTPGEPAATEAAPSPALRDDLISALVNLGYQRSQVDRAVRETLKHEANPSFETVLKGALRRLSS
jgi:Holliday junction DNA helicase RuvA